MEINVLEERMRNMQEANTKEHNAILAQVIKTNGKVAENTKWRWMGVGAISFITVVLLPIVFSLANNYFIK